MIRKILIDAGLDRREPCSGRGGREAGAPACRIGEALAQRLEQMGHEVLFSDRVPELRACGDGAGRPAACASVAKRWRADCVLRLCVRSSPHPEEGRAEAMVFRRQSGAWRLAETVLQHLDAEGDCISAGVRPASGMLLLRKTPCPGVILVLQLPFCQWECLEPRDAERYADCIAQGIGEWARTAPALPNLRSTVYCQDRIDSCGSSARYRST